MGAAGEELGEICRASGRKGEREWHFCRLVWWWLVVDWCWRGAKLEGNKFTTANLRLASVFTYLILYLQSIANSNMSWRSPISTSISSKLTTVEQITVQMFGSTISCRSTRRRRLHDLLAIRSSLSWSALIRCGIGRERMKLARKTIKRIFYFILL